MRHFLLIFFSVALLVSCNNENNSSTNADARSFTVTGTFKNTAARMLYFDEYSILTGMKTVKDSAMIGADGSFSLKASSAEESVFNIRFDNDPNPVISLINDTDKIQLEADFSKPYDFYSVSGSVASNTAKEYLKKLGELQREKFNTEKLLDSLVSVPGAGALFKITDSARKSQVNQLKEYARQQVLQSNSPALSLFILATYQGMANNQNFRMDAIDNEELFAIFDGLVNKFPYRADMASVRNSIAAQIPKAIWIGKQAPEIALSDVNGKIIKLSSYRGKYVLVDFWASWCGPCRRENPNVVNAYNRFKDKNFTILGVSLDAKKDDWKKAIEDDQLGWKHISDLKQWRSEVVQLYQIEGIPYNVLVDPEGKVVAENLRGSALEQKLERFLN